MHEAVELLQDIFWPRDIVIGGGNAKHLDPFPAGARRASNQDGIVGARRLWEGADYLAVPYGTTWRISKDGAPPASRTFPAIASSRPARKLRTGG